MKKQISNLGKALNKAEQKEVNGGGRKPELCDVVNGVIYSCVFPYRCSLNSDGTYSCV
jgi:hypothetical protein